MKILFYCDATEYSGIGHLIRCNNIAEYINNNTNAETAISGNIDINFIEEKGLKSKITRDTLVFGQPHFGWIPFSYKHIVETWREIRREVADKLIGHRFSPHPYTVYSLRSTFAEDHLLKGTPVLEVAEMMGHSVVETQKTYARLNLRKKGREITMPELGRRLRSEGEKNLID